MHHTWEYDFDELFIEDDGLMHDKYAGDKIKNFIRSTFRTFIKQAKPKIERGCKKLCNCPCCNSFVYISNNPNRHDPQIDKCIVDIQTKEFSDYESALLKEVEGE